MDKPKFTPGPWVYRPEEFDDWGVVRGSDIGDGWLTYICQAKDQRVTESGENEARRNGTDPWEANARLIAAAPDMYEALQKLCYLQAGGPSSGVKAEKWLGQARAALAKAEGRTDA